MGKTVIGMERFEFKISMALLWHTYLYMKAANLFNTQWITFRVELSPLSSATTSHNRIKSI